MQSHLNSIKLLFADAPSWFHMGNHFRSSGATEFPWHAYAALGTFMLIAACLVLIRMMVRKMCHKGFESSSILFLQLCKAHQLRLGDYRLLYKLAMYHQLEQPGLLFLRADLFDPISLGTRNSKQLLRYTQLRDQLFSRTTESESRATVGS